MFKKAVTAGLLTAFLTTNLFSSVRRTELSPVVAPPVLKSTPPPLQSYVRIRSPRRTNAPKSPITFFLIEDIHSNSEAQKNIGQALLALDANALAHGKKMLIAAEAASGAYDFPPARPFSDKAAQSKMADYLLQDDLISAVSWFGLTAPDPLPPVVGVDDQFFYLQNLANYQRSSSRTEELAGRVAAEMEEAVAQARATLLGPERAAFLAINDYYANRASLGEATRQLSAFTHEPLPASLSEFVRLLAVEKSIDRVQAEKEKNIFMAQQGDVLLEKLPALKSYLDYAQAADTLDLDRLYIDFGRFVEASTKDSRSLSRLYDLILLKKLVSFEMASDEWESYDRRRPRFSEPVQTFEDFYRVTQARNQSMVANALKSAEEQKADQVVFVAGAFHTRGLKTLLEGKGMTVTVLSPDFSDRGTSTGRLETSGGSLSKTGRKRTAEK